jgi:hypothetical protein
MKNHDFTPKNHIFFPIVEGDAKIVGVFRVKNNDFMPDNSWMGLSLFREDHVRQLFLVYSVNHTGVAGNIVWPATWSDRTILPRLVKVGLFGRTF